MKTRIISACVAAPLFFAVLYLAPPWCLPVLMAFLSVIGVDEMLHAVGCAGKNRAMFLACSLMAAFIPLRTYFYSAPMGAACVLFFLIALFLIGFFDREHIRFENICGCFFAAFVIPLFLSGIVRISMKENGIYFLILPFAVAWMCDTMAYFIGRALGKHKLSPHISPNKTVEGAIGGLFGGMAGALLVGWVMSRFFSAETVYFPLAVFGFFGAAISQIGDLSMSFIKRNFGVKDYGNIMPGHGGVLDRFDSVLFVTPAAELLIALAPNIFTWNG